MASKSKKGDLKFRSKQQIKCAYCGVSMRRDRLGLHTQEQHPGKAKREEGAVQSRSIMDLLQPRSTNLHTDNADGSIATTSASGTSDSPGDSRPPKRKSTDEIEGHIDKKSKCDDDSRELVTDDGGDRDNPTPESQEMEIDLTSDTLDQESAHDETKTLSEKLESVLATLADIKLSVKDKATPSDPGPGPSASNKKAASLSGYLDERDALKTLVQTAKSVARICELAGMTVNDDNNLISCDVCSATDSYQARVGSGKFNYDFSVGMDFCEKSQPVAFVNLKKSIVRHISTQVHLKNAAMKGDASEKLRKIIIQEQSIGMTLGKQVYRILKYARPFSDYEIDVKLLSDAKVKVGNLNHSRKFASELRPAFAEVVDSRIKQYFQTPLDATSHIPPIGIAADKLTTRRRTGQMYAAILFTPGMPSLLTPVSLGVTSVTKHDGQGIADDICELCSVYGIQADQIAGFGFDGQYFHLKVDRKIKDKLQLDDTVAFTWDAAHILQLADKDTRKENIWIDELCKDIASVLGKFSFGKTFESAIIKASELGIDFKAPLWFSDTRFAAYAHSVFKNFADNYQVVRLVLGKVAASDSTQAKDADALLGRIQKVDFVAKLLICVDLYSLMGILSQKLQMVNYPVWKKAEDVRTYLRALDDIIEEGSTLPTFDKYATDLQNCTFMGQPLLIKGRQGGLMMPARQTRSRVAEEELDEEAEDSDEHEVEVARRVQSTAAKGKTVAEGMKANMNKRFPHNFFDDIRKKEQSASLLPIITRARKATNETEMMSSDEVKLLCEMHSSQVEETRNLCINIYRNRSSIDCDNDIDLYHCVYTSPDLINGATHVLANIAKIFCSCPPESVVESMGSIIEMISKARGGSKTSTNQLDVKDISDELKVHWNGPHISRCEAVVKQALNLHFKGGRWHFVSQDVRAKLHKVSKVVDRINKTKPVLKFMLE